MNKLPWMKYDPDIVSLDVDGMSLAEEGAYSRAVRHLWRNGPLTRERLQRLCGPSFEAVILCMEEREGSWSLPWLEEARGTAKAWQTQRSEAGKASAKKRKENQRPFNDRSTVVLSPSISSLSDKGTRDEIEAQFEALWITFERYGAKGKALAYWKQLSAEDRAAVVSKAPAYVASTPGCEYRKQLEGWINPVNRLWERPIVQRGSSEAAKRPMTKEEAREAINEIRRKRGIPPGGVVETHLIPEHIRQVLARA